MRRSPDARGCKRGRRVALPGRLGHTRGRRLRTGTARVCRGWRGGARGVLGGRSRSAPFLRSRRRRNDSRHRPRARRCVHRTLAVGLVVAGRRRRDRPRASRDRVGHVPQRVEHVGASAAAAQLEIRHSLIVDMQQTPASTFGRAVEDSGGGSVALDHVVIDGAYESGIGCFQASSVVSATDVVVRSVAPSVRGFGFGAFVSGGRLQLVRAAFDSVSGAGVVAGTIRGPDGQDLSGAVARRARRVHHRSANQHDTIRHNAVDAGADRPVCCVRLSRGARLLTERDAVRRRPGRIRVLQRRWHDVPDIGTRFPPARRIRGDRGLRNARGTPHIGRRHRLEQFGRNRRSHSDAPNRRRTAGPHSGVCGTAVRMSRATRERAIVTGATHSAHERRTGHFESAEPGPTR